MDGSLTGGDDGDDGSTCNSRCFETSSFVALSGSDALRFEVCGFEDLAEVGEVGGMASAEGLDKSTEFMTSMISPVFCFLNWHPTTNLEACLKVSMLS
jgi:hypothetical protein